MSGTGGGASTATAAPASSQPSQPSPPTSTDFGEYLLSQVMVGVRKQKVDASAGSELIDMNAPEQPKLLAIVEAATIRSGRTPPRSRAHSIPAGSSPPRTEQVRDAVRRCGMKWLEWLRLRMVLSNPRNPYHEMGLNMIAGMQATAAAAAAGVSSDSKSTLPDGVTLTRSHIKTPGGGASFFPPLTSPQHTRTLTAPSLLTSPTSPSAAASPPPATSPAPTFGVAFAGGSVPQSPSPTAAANGSATPPHSQSQLSLTADPATVTGTATVTSSDPLNPNPRVPALENSDFSAVNRFQLRRQPDCFRLEVLWCKKQRRLRAAQQLVAQQQAEHKAKIMAAQKQASAAAIASANSAIANPKLTPPPKKHLTFLEREATATAAGGGGGATGTGNTQTKPAAPTSPVVSASISIPPPPALVRKKSDPFKDESPTERTARELKEAADEHVSSTFEFDEFAPRVFANIRASCGVSMDGGEAGLTSYLKGEGGVGDAQHPFRSFKSFSKG